MSDFWQEARAYAYKIGQKNLKLAKEKGVKFYTGKLVISNGLQRLGYSGDSTIIQECFSHFRNGDFGNNQPPEDLEINKRTIASGFGDVMGEYKVDGHRIWIKTDLSENTTTTIFLPEEW